MSGIENTEFLISNLSLPKPLLVAGSVSAHEDYMETIGADGIELTPVNVSRFMGRLLYRATMLDELAAHPASTLDRGYAFDQLGYDIRKDWSDEDDAFENLIRAQHSSFRNDVGDNGLVARMFPDWRKSLRQMSKIQRITGTLAAVLYPGFENAEVVYDDTNAPFAERTFQPTALDWHRMGLTEHSSIDDIKATMKNRGFTGITYDVGPHTEGFDDPAELAERLAAAGLIQSVHLSLNRLDTTGRHGELAKSTRDAKRAFARSAEAAAKTPEGERLRAIVRRWQEEEGGSSHRVVLEDGPLRLGGAARDHAAIIAHARELVNA